MRYSSRFNDIISSLRCVYKLNLWKLFIILINKDIASNDWEKRLAQLQRIVIAPQQQQEEEIRLTPQQQHYLYRVLRLGEGDRLIAMDGQGMSWLVQLHQTSAEILEPIAVETELSITVTLMVALPKGSGFDQVVRCCTELGVTTLIPLVSDRTLLKPSSNKLERWQRIAREAAEQSERQIVPTIAAPTLFPPKLELMGNEDTHRYICVARSDVPHLLNCLQQTKPRGIAIATGPEGGWTASEIEQASEAGFQPVSLGDRILRGITAPITAFSVVAAVAEQSWDSSKSSQ